MTKWGCLQNQAQVQIELFEALLSQHRLRFCWWRAENINKLSSCWTWSLEKVDFNLPSLSKWMYLDSEFMTSWIVIALCLWINTFYFICRSQIIKILSIWCCKIVKTWWKPDKHFFFWWSKKWMTSLVMLFMVSPWLLTLTWP